MKCYNCRKDLKPKENNREHIPAANLFAGFDNSTKDKIITVPACFECNNTYSPTDEEFRNMLGIINNKIENKFITEKTVRSFLRKESSVKRLNLNDKGEVAAVEFSEKTLIDYHTKNFKGLYYHEYNQPLPLDYEIVVNTNENDWSNETLAIISYLKDNFKWKKSSNENVFKYIIEPFRENLINPEKEDLILKTDEPLIICMMIYNNLHGALVFGIKYK